MKLQEVIEQLDSLILNSEDFHEEKGDIWEKDIEALKETIRILNIVESFIQGTEFAIDNGLDIPKEDYELYLKLVKGGDTHDPY